MMMIIMMMMMMMTHPCQHKDEKKKF